MMTTLRKRWRTILLLVLFLVAFLPRALYPVSRPLQWYERGFRFVDAVFHGQWADTVVSEHPGVTSMWLIGLAQHGYYAWLRSQGVDPPHPLDIADRAFPTEVVVSVLPLALAIALSVLLIWWLLRNLFDEAVAWAGAGLLALDPFHIAVSKVVHVDALLSVLMILSALTLLYHLRRGGAGEQERSFWSRYRWLLASGLLAGLSFLTKSPAYFLVPFLGLSLLVTRGRAHLWRDYVLPVLLWAGVAAVTYVALWPAMWVQPGQTLTTVIEGVFKHTDRAHPQPLAYLGELVTTDPGLGYYVVAVLVKTTVLSLPLFVIGLVSPVMAVWRRERQSLALLVAYFAFFFLQMGLGAKKAPRYLLPAFAALDIIAGVGLVTLARRIRSLSPWREGAGIPLHPPSPGDEVAGVPLHPPSPGDEGAGVPLRPLSPWGERVRVRGDSPRPIPAWLIVVALAIQALLVLPYHPYYITHANLLAGGPAGARDLLLGTPEGEGLDQVADYLNSLPDADQLRVGVQLPAREAFRQRFVGQVADTREPDLDYLLFAEVYVTRHMAEDQWGEQWEVYKYRVPEYTVYLHDLPYAWLYRVDDDPQPPAVPLRVCLGEHIRMQGYTLVVDGAPLGGQVLHPGDSLRLTLHWGATGAPEGDYSIFVHLLGPDGTLVAQQDNPPLHGTFPTFLWRPGERVDDPYELTIPPDAPPGPYTLSVGMYDWRTGERLPALADCLSRLPEDRILLATFDVELDHVAWWQPLTWLIAGLVVISGLVGRQPNFAPFYTWVKHWWIPLTYAALTVVMTWPVVARLGTRYVGGSTDMWMFPWEDWWCLRCLLEGHSPFYTTSIFYPYGVSTVYHNFAWLNSAMWIPLSPLVGPVAAHNLIFLFNLALAGVGMHLFVHYLTKDHRAALLAGVIFAFWPYRMSHYNHPNMISVGWVPFCMLFLARAIREKPKLKLALLAGLFLALTGIARWMHLIYTSGLILLYLICSLLFERRHWNRRTFVALGVTFGLAALLMAPLLSPLVVTQIQGGEQAEDVFIEGGSAWGTDLVSYLVPEPGHPLFQPWLGELWGRMRGGGYVGYVALALAGLGLLKGPHDRVVWLVAGAGLFILALGSDLQVAGQSLGISLPYSWVQNWAPIRVMRHPHRFNILLSFPVAVLAGYGTAWLLRRTKLPLGWTLALTALLLVEYLPWPYPTSPADIPPFYQQLAAETDDFAILDLPLAESSAAKLYMYYSTIHGKPLVGGRVARLPRSAYAFIDSIPLLHGLHEDDEMDPELGDVSRQLSALAQANVRYVILHPSWLTPDRLVWWRKWLAVSPVYEDQSTIVYRTALQYGRDFDFVGTMGDGIGVIGAKVASVSSHQGQTLKVDVVWGSQEAPERDWLAGVALVDSSGAQVQRAPFVPCVGWPTVQWGENAVARGQAALELHPGVVSGTYTVTLALVDPATGTPATEPLVIDQVEIPESDLSPLPLGGEG